jgi:hypothetical protein
MVWGRVGAYPSEKVVLEVEFDIFALCFYDFEDL